MDLLTCVKTFVRIADAGSISKAARAAGISVAMASRHLSSLESELGGELVQRTTRHLRMTDAGADFLARARRLLREVDEAKDAVRGGKDVRGRIVVSLPVSLGLSQISELVPPLLVKHPRLQLDLRFEDRMIELLAESVDVAIRVVGSPPDSTSLVARKLTAFQRILCASPDFLARVGPIDEPRALEGVSCLIQGAGAERWRLDTVDGVVEVTVDGPLRTTNLLALRDAALAGVGVAQLPLTFVADDLKRKRLLPVLKGAVPRSGVIYGIYHQSARRSAAIQAFLDHVAEGMSRGSAASIERATRRA